MAARMALARVKSPDETSMHMHHSFVNNFGSIAVLSPAPGWKYLQIDPNARMQKWGLSPSGNAVRLVGNEGPGA
jgi:hypothetical protein